MNNLSRKPPSQIMTLNRIHMVRLNCFVTAAIIVLAMMFAGQLGAQEQKRSAEEVLKAGTAEAKGKAIFEELDRRDLGFGDLKVEMEMILRNSQGDQSKRRMRNRIFETADTSLGDKTLIVFDVPLDVKGTAFLTHSKILQSDDQWLYLPALKRVKRISSKNKSGPFMGSEFAFEDISSQEVEKFTYKYLRNEPCPNDAGLSCFVVERYPRYEHSGYTRQIGCVNTAEFRLMDIEYYDRKDAKLKTLTFSDYKQYLNRYWRAGTLAMVNHQTGKSTDLLWNNYQFRIGMKESDFTKSKLKRIR